MSLKSSRSVAPFGLRMPEQLKKFIEFQAESNGRSMNAEVMARLVSSITESEFHRFCDSQGAEKGEDFVTLHSVFSEMGYDPNSPHFQDMSIEAVNDLLSGIYDRLDSIQKNAK